MSPPNECPTTWAALHAEVGQQPPAVLGVLREAHGSLGGAAARVPAAMVGDQPVPARQAALRQQRPERVGDEGAVDADDRLTRARLLVLQRDAVDDRRIPPHHAFPAPRRWRRAESTVMPP